MYGTKIVSGGQTIIPRIKRVLWTDVGEFALYVVLTEATITKLLLIKMLTLQNELSNINISPSLTL